MGNLHCCDNQSVDNSNTLESIKNTITNTQEQLIQKIKDGDFIPKFKPLNLKNLLSNKLKVFDKYDLFSTETPKSVESVYSVKDNIDPLCDSAFIYFLIDIDIYKKEESLVSNGIFALLCDFKNYFLHSVTKRKTEFLKICAIGYDENQVFEPVLYKFDENIKHIKDFIQMDGRETQRKYSTLADQFGEICGLNAILKSKVDHSIDPTEGVFLFHFCNKSSKKDAIYGFEVNPELRNIELKYDLILISGDNKKYVSQIEPILAFTPIIINS